MPALAASSDVVGRSMCVCSHIPNTDASVFVRTYGNDFPREFSHNRNMARRGIPKQINWYLKEWMDSLEVSQADMCRRTGWSKATASQLYNNVQDYSPRLVNEAAEALGVRRFELLMRPEEAMRLRREQGAGPKPVKPTPAAPAVKKRAAKR